MRHWRLSEERKRQRAGSGAGLTALAWSSFRSGSIWAAEQGGGEKGPFRVCCAVVICNVIGKVNRHQWYWCCAFGTGCGKGGSESSCRDDTKAKAKQIPQSPQRLRDDNVAG